MRLLIVLLLLNVALCTEAQKFDVLHYAYDINLSDDNDTLYGKAIIDVQFEHFSKIVSFHLKNVDATGRGMFVTKAFVLGVEDANILPELFVHERDEVVMPFVPTFSRWKNIRVLIEFKGIPSDGLIISKNKYGDRTFFADNWPNRAHHWLPCIDRPNDKASFEFTVHAPSQYSVISNGVKVEEKEEGNGMKLTHWKEDIPSPTKVMVIGVAKFATKIFDDTTAGVPVSAWVYPQDSAKGFYDYAITPSIVRFLSDYIAPFPYKKLANVQSKTIFGGMENASCIFYAENSVTGNRSEEDLMVHEIAHQWFGDMASEKSFAHLWLSEGFATYLTNYYFEKKYGKEAAQKRWTQQREEVIQFAKANPRPVVDSTTNLMSLLNANSYQKGAWVLYMLRSEVGDAVFQKIIQTYYNRYKGGNADSRDFERVAEDISGKELTPFFKQWLYRPGVPHLAVSTSVKGDELKVSVVQAGTPFQLNLPVSVQLSNGKTITQTLNVKDRLGLFKIPLPEKGAKVMVDPQAAVLFEEVR